MCAKEVLKMIRDRRFAFVFRLGSFLFAAFGLLDHVGVFSGEFKPSSFMYYTIQSNLLAVLLFGLLTARTAIGLREGTHGSSSWHPRLGMVVAVDLLITLIIFWGLLVPQGMDPGYLWSFDNFAVHTVTPLLCLLDYVLFSEPRRLKYRDVYYVCIFPLCYAVFSWIAGFTGYIYQPGNDLVSDQMESVSTRFPYFFLDFDQLGWWVFAYAAAILVFFLLLGHVIYFIDRKIRKREAN